jgi:putative SOS response-associated peptidase YedK
MSAIHDRMPVILTKKDEAAWLDEANNSQGKVAVLIRPMADGNLDMYVVSDEVNSPRNNSPELLQPVT